MQEHFTLNSLLPLPVYAGDRHLAQKQSSSNGSLPALSTVLHRCVYQTGPGLSEEFQRTTRDPFKARNYLEIMEVARLLTKYYKSCRTQSNR